MCDSESDSDLDEIPHDHKEPWEICNFPNVKSIDYICEKWSQIPLCVKRKNSQGMRVHIFWPILFKPTEGSCAAKWATEAGFIDASLRDEMSMKRLQMIEILETFLNAFGKGILDDVLARQLFEISLNIQIMPDCIKGAIDWLEKVGEPGLSAGLSKFSRLTRLSVLSFLCSKFVNLMAVLAIRKHEEIEWFETTQCPCCLEKSENMKRRGNDQFAKKNYDAAIKWYSKAIQHQPENHILYGNRALCYIHSEKYQKAIGDGKRTTILKPNWPKGHYRMCDALFLLGEYQKALQANEKAQDLCRDSSEGIQELIQQSARFRCEMQKIKGSAARRKNKFKGCHSQKPETLFKSCTDNNGGNTEEAISRQEDCNFEINPSCQGGARVMSGMKKEELEPNIRVIPAMHNSSSPQKRQEKMKVKGASHHPVEKASSQLTPGNLHEKLQSFIHDGHIALADHRFRNAEQAFSQALDILDSTTLKDVNFSPVDHIVLIYGYATALREVGQPEELAEAEIQFNKIKTKFPKERRLQCIAYYGIGMVYFTQNRFSDALDQFQKSLIMINLQIVPGKLTWPTTTVVVDETQNDYLKSALEKSMEMCKFPPKPDAVCRFQQCLGNSKIQIYFKDPDFKGFIRIICSQKCCIEYHISCWKKMKSVMCADKNDKDFLYSTCFTADCMGKISRLVIFGSTGLIKCEFESNIQRSKEILKPAVKQKASSIKKLKSKEDRKLRRKLMRRKKAMEPVKPEYSHVEDEDKIEKEVKDKVNQQSWMIYRDRVLHQITEKKDLLKEGVEDVSVLYKYLKPWTEKDNEGVCLLTSSDPHESMGHLVDFLGHTKNRVATRVFIKALKHCQVISPELLDWINRLNNSGLKSAETFINRYSASFEELDLNPVFEFTPLMDTLVENFGSKPEFLNNTITIVDYFKQSPLEEKRLFIWSLEENREKFPSLYNALDEYFEIMDASCIVLKKHGIENPSQASLKVKSRSRKKKIKDSKPVYVLSGIVGSSLREDDEEDDIFTDEDTLMLLGSYDPFVVPEYLRHQVAEFEGQTSSNLGSSSYRQILDNNPDPTRESLYDYFAQILEEHGPLETDNYLLVGQLENFPIQAQEMVQHAGGLKAFLLESLRFVLMNNLIGLMKHAVSLQDKTMDIVEVAAYYDNISFGSYNCENDNFCQNRPLLNPSADEFKPSFIEADYSHHFSAAHTTPFSGEEYLLTDSFSSDMFVQETFPYTGLTFDSTLDLPSPRELESGFFLEDSSNFCNSTLCTNFSAIVNISDDSSSDFSNSKHNQIRFEASKIQTEIVRKKQRMSNILIRRKNKSIKNLKKKKKKKEDSIKTLLRTIGTQVHYDLREHVAINTDPFQPFESRQGDIIRHEKEYGVLQEQLKEAEEKYEQFQQNTHEVTSLEQEISEIDQKTEITRKELELLRQKLESDVKKTNQEKKERQEALKVLRNKIKSQNDANELCSKNIEESKNEYQTLLAQFIDLSNQSASERMKLEEQIKKHENICAEVIKRAVSAEVNLLEYQRTGRLYTLYKAASEGQENLRKLKLVAAEVASPSVFHYAIETWQTYVSSIESKIRFVESQYSDHILKIRNGEKLRNLRIISVPSPSSAPDFPKIPRHFNDSAALHVSHATSLPGPHGINCHPHHPSVQIPHNKQMQSTEVKHFAKSTLIHSDFTTGKSLKEQEVTEQTSHGGGAISAPVHPNSTVRAALISDPSNFQSGQTTKSSSQQQLNKFEEIIKRLQTLFPHYSRSCLTSFIKEVRSANGGSINTLSGEEIINRVAQHILDHQEKTRDRFSAGSSKVAQMPLSHPWKTVTSKSKPEWQKTKASLDEDPCIICHEEMCTETVCVLECKHSFHRECIKAWLKEQSTCPTCRVHALLPEDFPVLPAKIRLASVPASPS
ncbi:E3 ubiquitin-protein ligase TTC3 [Erpetoichthys calabaricus]|uniref:E3 ubiquitin-protein ligase TTC3 n=1 Tax=Erpetoichthys calabaricus TaxID=27687 RepID=UPI00109FFA54|nr:E3 ubiquitin-protein ligase TTC3 [Erpetoichthys calabaricus]